ncbi:MAG: MarR family winged helix-turn-helix transcriptional regulator [Frankiaceae bacterium]
MDERWLSAPEQRAWRAYLRSEAMLRAHMNRQLQADSGLSLTDYDVLAHLSETPGGRVRYFELGEALQWEQSRVSHQLARMARRGLVARECCTGDARGAFVVLTAEGRAAIETAAPGHVAAVRAALFEGLSKDDVATLERICGQVIARVADASAPPEQSRARAAAR